MREEIGCMRKGRRAELRNKRQRWRGGGRGGGKGRRDGGEDGKCHEKANGHVLYLMLSCNEEDKFINP